MYGPKTKTKKSCTEEHRTKAKLPHPPPPTVSPSILIISHNSLFTAKHNYWSNHEQKSSLFWWNMYTLRCPTLEEDLQKSERQGSRLLAKHSRVIKERAAGSSRFFFANGNSFLRTRYPFLERRTKRLNIKKVRLDFVMQPSYSFMLEILPCRPNSDLSCRHAGSIHFHRRNRCSKAWTNPDV